MGRKLLYAIVEPEIFNHSSSVSAAIFPFPSRGRFIGKINKTTTAKKKIEEMNARRKAAVYAIITNKCQYKTLFIGLSKLVTFMLMHAM